MKFLLHDTNVLGLPKGFLLCDRTALPYLSSSWLRIRALG